MLDFLIHTGNVLLGINLIIFLLKFNKLPRALLIFLFYLLVMLVIQISSAYLRSQKITNLYLAHYYFILQFVILSFFYFQILKNPFQRKVIKIAVPFCLIILGSQYYLNNDLYDKFNLFEIFITSFLLIIFSMFHFYNILNEKKEYYYINTGILLYLFGSTVLFMSGNLISRLDLASTEIIWILNSILYILYQIFILIEWKGIFFKKR